ncbi:MAG: ABC transporter ATP-binding protein, partial [Candidatus Methanomethylophilaceae archaeon]|nr:ABC transporter ATP-binding protein [Candidatus Methanomethylophilaceae archaeon]
STHCGMELNKMALDLCRNIRTDLNRKITTMPTGVLEGMSAGDLTSRIVTDLPAVKDLISRDYMAFFSGSLLTLLILLVMILVSPVLALSYVITMPATLIVSRIISKKSAKDYEIQKRMLNDIDAEMSEIVSNHREIKTHNLESAILEKFEISNRRFTEAKVNSESRSGLIPPLASVASNLGYVVTAVAGALMLFNGMLDLGTFLAFMIYVRLINGPVLLSATTVDRLRSEITSLNRILEIIGAPEAEDGETAPDSAYEGKITFRDVRFSYTDAAEVLHGISFEVSPGEIVAISGPTGSGKTTIVSLLLRFYNPSSGEVLIDDINIKNISRRDLSRTIGSVMQEPWIFRGTIRENIVYNRDWITEDDLTRAMEVTGLHRLTGNLPQGLDTAVDNDLLSLPLAFKRMIAMTRAIAGEPGILILDEALSGLDPVTESAIFDGLKKMMSGRTVIIVSHDRRLTSQADRIISLNDGKIADPARSGLFCA